MSKSNPPVKRFKLRRVEACVWAREDKEDGFIRYSITVQKSFRDKDSGEWVNSGFFFPEEAAVAQALIGQALGWIAEPREERSGKVSEEKDAPF